MFNWIHAKADLPSLMLRLLYGCGSMAVGCVWVGGLAGYPWVFGALFKIGGLMK